ncbi:class I SAM-dependent methyltransferase [Tistrella bauzanensis]
MDGIADRRLVAWVTRRPGADPQGDAVLARDRVAEWRALYETAGPADTAGADSGIADPADDDALFAGWNSSYTGRAIPAAEMRRWRDQTVAAIRRLFPAAHPPHLVEIGCGAGLLLDPLAEHVASCLGTDFSAATLAGLEARLAVRAASGTTAAPIRLLRQEAADPLPLDGVTADLVVMNSVAQYFPGPDHLLQVLTRIGEALAGRGPPLSAISAIMGWQRPSTPRCWPTASPARPMPPVPGR